MIPVSRVLSRRQLLKNAAALSASLTLVACGGPPVSPNKTYTIGFIPGTLAQADFYISAKNGAASEAARLKQNLLVQAPAQFSAVLQIPLVDALVARKVNALIIAPCDSQALIAPLQRAHDAGIPVLTFDTYIGNGDYAHGPVTFPLSYIGSDNTLGGKLLAEALIKEIGGSGKVYLQNLAPGTSTTDQRAQGFKDAIAATKGAVTLVGENFDDGNVSKATAQTSAILQRYPDLAGIAGTNLFSSYGVTQAVKTANRVRTTKVAFFDCPREAVIDLRQGSVDVLLAQEPQKMGKMALDMMVQSLNAGDTGLQKHIATGFHVVTRDNLDTKDIQDILYQTN